MAIPPPLRERRVFVDSSAYLALLDADDEHHADAVQVVQRVIEHRYRQFTTNVIVIEAHALILSTLGVQRAGRFLRDMDESRTAIVRVRAQDEERAKVIIFRYGDKDFSFADAISFVVMQRLRILYAFSFDQHFAQHGFSILTPDLLS